jgi:hypothetical protein
MASVRPEAGPVKATVFVSDPSAEAERVAQSLRGASYTVVDVPLSMLIARVAVQRPRVVVVDCDSDGALEIVAKMRELPESDSIDVLFMGRLGGAFQVPEEALVHEGSGFFERPVDGDAVVRKVNALLQIDTSSKPPPAEEAVDAGWKPKSDLPPPPAPVSQPATRSIPPLAGVMNDAQIAASSRPPISAAQKSTPPSQRAPLPPIPIDESPPSDLPALVQKGEDLAPESISSRPPNSTTSLAPPGIREAPSQPPPSMPRVAKSPSQPPMSAPPLRARRGAQGPLSEELMQLLAEAEERLGGEAVMHDSPTLSPEEEIDAVLPEEVLAALDEPLEEQEDDDVNDSAMGTPGNITTSGGSKQTTGASRRHTTGVPAEPSTGSVMNPSSEANSSPQHSSPTSSNNAPFGVRVSAQPVLPPAMAPVTFGQMPITHSLVNSPAMSSPTISPQHHGGTTTTHGLTANPTTNALPNPTTSGGDSNPRAFRTSSSDFPANASPMSAEPATSPRGDSRNDSPRSQSSRPPPTAMTPSTAGFTLGSDLMMPAAVALEAVHAEALRERQQQILREQQHQQQQLQHQTSMISPEARQTSDIPAVLGPGDAPRAIAKSIATRTTGTLCLESKEGVRRVVLREGDLVTAASGVDDESLIAFLVAHGDLPRESLTQLAGRFATFGRHAGAALVAQGYLRQDQLWPVLRAHAEWILGKAIAIESGSAVVEPDAPGRLRGEPSVFGGSTGAEVFVEVVRRVISQEDAFARLGGGPARIGEGRNEGLLTECALGAPEVAVLEQLRGMSLAQALATSPDTDMIAVLYALHLLGVIEVMKSIANAASARDPSSAPRVGLDTIDDDAIRARVRARLDLVEEGDYFAVLGVPKSATSYEVRRAFTELRRVFDPDRILTPTNADLAPSIRKIVTVLEEAYDILRDSARRERYRRAIDASPQ